MTTGAFPNLQPARVAIERLLADTCTVERDAAGVGDDVLNEQTGQLQRPAGDASALWAGPCLITPRDSSEQFIGPTETVLPERGDYRLLLPLAAPATVAGDRVTVTTSVRDPQLTGRLFRVVEVGELSTFAVVRILGVELL